MDKSKEIEKIKNLLVSKYKAPAYEIDANVFLGGEKFDFTNITDILRADRIIRHRFEILKVLLMEDFEYWWNAYKTEKIMKSKLDPKSKEGTHE